jgi:hypothetical protein
MAGTVVLALLVVTTGLAILCGAILGRLSIAALPRALGQLFECVGISCAFALLNLSLGVLGVLAVRAVFGAFVSLYYVNDSALIALSFLQGVLFYAWRVANRARTGR